MWIALNDGFISVVAADPKRLPKAERKILKGYGRPLCVRARNRAHLEQLFPGRTVYEWRKRDYPARVFIGSDTFATMMIERIERITYGNFKDSVRDGELHDAYLGVWHVMHQYQHGSYRRAPLTTFGHLVRRAGPDLYDHEEPWLEMEPDVAAAYDASSDQTCGLLGCTPEHPCMDCMIEALKDEHPTTARQEDRYGDFDEREDEAAASHLRIPPR